MDVLDDVTQREILLRAEETLRENLKKAEEELNHVRARIDLKQQEYRAEVDKLDAVRLYVASEIAKAEKASKDEAAQIGAKNEMLRQELLRLESAANAKRGETDKMVSLLNERIAEKRSELALASSSLESARNAQRAVMEGLAKVQESMKGAGL